jgi:hypothetical protein
MTTGEQLRIEGITANLAAATAGHRPYRWHAEKALADLVKSRREFTADDIRNRIPKGVVAHHVNVLPSVIANARSRGDIVPVGRCRTTRPSRHSSRNTVWTAAPSEGVAV